MLTETVFASEVCLGNVISNVDPIFSDTLTLYVCNIARGIANPNLAGYVVAVAEQAKDLADASSELPVVKIESETA